jgi:aminomethyltransferase
MTESRRTVLYDRHVELGAKIVEFGGWDMPLNYPPGIMAEHLATRSGAGLFDVSHMGRFVFSGEGASAFLQHVLSNNAAALDAGEAQYTMIPNADGGAVDDAYLYRFTGDEYLLVVNAANRAKDWDHFQSHLATYPGVTLTDRSAELAMISLQGPKSKEMLCGTLDCPGLPEPRRNALGIVQIEGRRVMVARTGYTGEPLCFELFVESADALYIWDRILNRGATPVGLGARDTLRLEASLPLYGHELGAGPDGRDIPIFACPLAKFAVSFSTLKGDYIGRAALEAQHAAWQELVLRRHCCPEALPRIVRPIALSGKGVARGGAKVYDATGQRHVGYVTSGTMVPHWLIENEGLAARFVETHELRAIGLALLDTDLTNGQNIVVEIRSKMVPAVIVPYHLRSEAPPYARPIVYSVPSEPAPVPVGDLPAKALDLLTRAARNTQWRQQQCINLIPSEQTLSSAVRLLSVMDPAFRYAEHRSFKAFGDVDVAYYQGTDFIRQVEFELAEQMRLFLGARSVETRVISGQMANATVFSAMCDYINRADRKVEPRRMRKVVNNGILSGGHLSSQPMGALRDYVARDGRTERPAVVNLPLLAGNPFKTDVPAAVALIAEHRPELIIFGKSMVLHPEPVAEIRKAVDDMKLDCVIMYDMAHVLGLVGPHFQEPFADGADVVTGSTHKTFYGTQRGVIASRFDEKDPDRGDLWDAVTRRAFPGAVSNHHLGTMLGLLLAAYEMNHFKDAYQQAVLRNAKAFARALARAGLDVAGDETVSYTETHQVLVKVGYGRGPEMADRLERNNIIVNYQAVADEEGFSAAGALRMGVAEMTRFGMGQAGFESLAQLMADVVLTDKDVSTEVSALRDGFTELQYTFTGDQFDQAVSRLRELL